MMMHLSRKTLFSLCAILLLCVSPACALVTVVNPQVRPEGPLSPRVPVQASFVIAVIPSGATTFPPGHSLVLSTDLLSPEWLVETDLDGVPNDRLTRFNNVVFFNGFLLSYPTTRDVSLVVNLTGEVPSSGNVTLFRVVELDNQGVPVPGSEYIVPAAIATLTTIPPATPVGSTVAVSSPAPVTTTPFSYLCSFVALIFAALILHFATRR